MLIIRIYPDGLISRNKGRQRFLVWKKTSQFNTITLFSISLILLQVKKVLLKSLNISDIKKKKIQVEKEVN